MLIPYVSFTSNKRSYLIRETSISQSWPDSRHADVETFVLSTGKVLRATNIKRFNFIDIAAHQDPIPVTVNDKINF